MHFLDCTPDESLDAVCARLARLMYNMETGSRTFEWRRGSARAPHAKPEKNFLQIELPGVTEGSPPLTAVYKPSKLFVVVPSGLASTADVADKVSAILDAWPKTHLGGNHPVEASSGAVLRKSGIAFGESPTDVVLRRPYTSLQRKGELYWGRIILVWPQDHTPNNAPTHVNYRAAVTWNVLTCKQYIDITRPPVTSLGDFNAIVAAVIVDSISGRERPPDYDSVSCKSLFEMELPAGVPALFNGLSKVGAVLIYESGRFHAARDMILYKWAEPRAERKLANDAKIANAPPSSPLAHVCPVCDIPLWGDVYTIRKEETAPYEIALCRWCAGSHRAEDFARHSTGVSEAEAFRGTKFEAFLPLLEAKTEMVEVPQTHSAGTKKIFVVRSPGGDYVLDVRGTSEAEIPAFVRYEAARRYKLPTVNYPFVGVARLR